ncbi:MAG: cupin domain-containing protein [Solirubrobacteraceae bacterium]|nr:cupin domain-containing protein [Solirubrobacteraceae bacterium]
MLEPGQVVRSPRGTTIEVLENSPERFRIRRTFPPGTGAGKAHYHLDGSERFTVIEGSAVGSVDGEDRLLVAGEVMEVAPATSHVHPHPIDGRAVIEHEIYPRPDFVPVYFGSYLTWLEEGRCDVQDEPTISQVMAILRVAHGNTWVTGVPITAQKGVAALVGRIAAMRGLRPVVPSR